MAQWGVVSPLSVWHRHRAGVIRREWREGEHGDVAALRAGATSSEAGHTDPRGTPGTGPSGKGRFCISETFH